MWFWWFMLIFDLLVPLIMIIGGYFMWKHSPKTMNGLITYRTFLFMKNIDTWKFALEYCGRLWWKIGWIILLPSFAIHILIYNASDDTIDLVGVILATIQTIILIGSLYPTERALRKNFDQSGNRKQ